MSKFACVAEGNREKTEAKRYRVNVFVSKAAPTPSLKPPRPKPVRDPCYPLTPLRHLQLTWSCVLWALSQFLPVDSRGSHSVHSPPTPLPPPAAPAAPAPPSPRSRHTPHRPTTPCEAGRRSLIYSWLAPSTGRSAKLSSTLLPITAHDVSSCEITLRTVWIVILATAEG